jgi:uncharacterized protein YycO
MAELGIPYQHVEAVTQDGFYLGSHLSGGVQRRPTNYDAENIRVELFADISASDEQTKTFYDFLSEHIGKPYDLTAILSLAEGFTTDRAPSLPETYDCWICSALQIAALMKAGLVKSAPQQVRLTTTRDVLVITGVLGSANSIKTRSGGNDIV